MILETQKNIFNLMASENANRLIYHVKRIPVVGKFLPDGIYANLSLNKKHAVIAAVLKVLGGILGKAVFVGLLIVLPAALLEKNPEARFAAFLHTFAVLNLIGSFSSSSLFASGEERYICVRLMRMNAKAYIVSTVLLHKATDFFGFLPAVLLSTVWMGGTPAQGFLLTFISTGFSLIGEASFLLFYSRTGIMLSKKTAYVVTVSLLCLAASYVPPVLHRPLMLRGLLFHPLFFCLLSALLLCSVLVILRYNKYHEIAYKTLKAADFTVNVDEVMSEAALSDVALREKDFSDSDLKPDRFENKKGFAYLNALFFERHRRLLVKPIIIRLVIAAVLFCAAVVASRFIPDLIKPLSNPGAVLPAFVFILYFASIGERVCKAMFYNCDISLLRYPFYRSRNAVLSNFKVRLLRVAGLNLITAAAISSAVIGLVCVFGLKWALLDLFFFTLSILLLSLFFSVHHLFLYYVFQPYTSGQGIKNPFFNLINTGVYFLCFLCLKLKSPPPSFTLIVLLSTSVYMIVALILVYRLAPKTFRVK